MIAIEYSRRFLRDFEKLSPSLQEEIIDKLELFRGVENHKKLHVHKLHGGLEGRLSFSVNYRFRIIFEYVGKGKKTAALITVGDHSIYD